MAKEIKKIAVLTSGGDAPGMNAAIRAVVRASIYYGKVPFGIYRGYDGLIDNEIEELGPRSVSNIIQRGGTVLKSARSKRFMTPEGRRAAVRYSRSSVACRAGDSPANSKISLA